jgi:hypothetical protein
MNFSEFLKLHERHIAPMSSQRVSSRKSRRDYIEEQLYLLGYDFIIDEESETAGSIKENTINMFDSETKEKPKFRNYFIELVNKFRKPKQSNSYFESPDKFNDPEFIEYCIEFWGDEPKYFPREDREEAYNDFLQHKTLMKDFPIKYDADLEYDTKFQERLSKVNDPFVVNFYRNQNNKDNIVVFANGFDLTRPTRVLMAHYDVNTESPAHDNANDNGAAIIVLLEYLEERRFPSNKNIVVVFTDGEEFGGHGSQKFGKQVKEGLHGDVEWVLNLDLVGVGDKMIFDNTTGKLRTIIDSLFGDTVGFVDMPPNDAMFMRRQGVESTILTLINKDIWDEATNKMKGRPVQWQTLHTPKDAWNTIELPALEMTFDAVKKIMSA